MGKCRVRHERKIKTAVGQSRRRPVECRRLLIVEGIGVGGAKYGLSNLARVILVVVQGVDALVTLITQEHGPAVRIHSRIHRHEPATPLLAGRVGRPDALVVAGNNHLWVASAGNHTGRAPALTRVGLLVPVGLLLLSPPEEPEEDGASNGENGSNDADNNADDSSGGEAARAVRVGLSVGGRIGSGQVGRCNSRGDENGAHGAVGRQGGLRDPGRLFVGTTWTRLG